MPAEDSVMVYVHMHSYILDLVVGVIWWEDEFAPLHILNWYVIC